MGLFKTMAKVVGTVALTTTGVASTVLKGVADAAGVEIASDVLGAVKDGSFDGIRSMWDGDEAADRIDVAENLSYDIEYGIQDGICKTAAQTAYRAAQLAKKNGDMEKYEYYMDVYNSNK